MTTLFDEELAALPDDAPVDEAPSPKTSSQVQRDADEALVLSVVRRFPKYTRDELWQRLEIEQPGHFRSVVSVQALLMGLLRIGAIDTVKERKCRISGNIVTELEAAY